MEAQSSQEGCSQSEQEQARRGSKGTSTNKGTFALVVDVPTFVLSVLEGLISKGGLSLWRWFDCSRPELEVMHNQKCVGM